VSRLACRLSGIRYRLLAFNALLVFLPVAGILFLDTYERQLLADQERSMVEQGRVLAAALSGRGPLEAHEVRHTLVQLGQRSGARIRVVDADGYVLADSSLLGPRRAEQTREHASRPGDSGSWLYRMGSLPFRLYRKLLQAPEPPHGSADVYASGGPLLGPELRAAFQGRYGAATRISSGGQRSVTLYSAVPVLQDGHPHGAVLVSQSTYRILQALYRVRSDVFRVFLATLAAAVVLSLLVSHTIARPLERLRNQAEALVARRGRLLGRFETPQRLDEIGDLARSLEALRARLDLHIRGVEAFASDVSHEFKNPLASIRTAAEMLAEVDEPDQRERFLAVVEREVARMERMLSGVREISRLDVGVGGEDREEVDLEALVRGVVESHHMRQGTPTVLRPAAEPLRVLASPGRLGRAVANLLDNAASFNPPGLPVEIEVRRDAGFSSLRVLDRGPGVPPEHRERIFDRFFSYRPDADERGAASHTGLGLSIARAIAESEGGRIEVRNRDGGGACFELRMPRSESRATVPPATAPTSPDRREPPRVRLQPGPADSSH
jgi:two-component system sensor histidine kinase ChvG